MSGIFGGGSAGTDRKGQLTAESDLGNVFNFALPFGQKQAGAGASTLQQALSTLGLPANYYTQILSGNRTATAAAAQPATEAATSAADAAKRQIATSGTSRGGGTAGTNQQIDDSTRKAITDAVFQAKPAAAQGLTQVAGVESGIGATELQAALSSLGLASSSASSIGNIATNARSTDLQQQNAIGSGIANVALAFLGL